jgi:hypothetical protein
MERLRATTYDAATLQVATETDANNHTTSYQVR